MEGEQKKWKETINREFTDFTDKVRSDEWIIAFLTIN
jgi:hypothetical protein